LLGEFADSQITDENQQTAGSGGQPSDRKFAGERNATAGREKGEKAADSQIEEERQQSGR
jgi:hypothetical protein